MIIASVKIYPRAGLEQDTLDLLESLKGPIATNSDCLSCSIAIELGEVRAVCYLERWQTREALVRHLRSPLYGRILEAMECSSVPPEIEFYEAIGVGGLELVQEARLPH